MRLTENGSKVEITVWEIVAVLAAVANFLFGLLVGRWLWA